jgi:hypothetical protein
LDTFGRETSALQLAALLNDAGIEALVSSDDAGGLLPQMGMTQGYAVQIDASQWDEAEAILKSLSGDDLEEEPSTPPG